MRFLLGAGFFLVCSHAIAGQDLAQAAERELTRLVAKNHGYGGGVLRISDADGVIWEGASGRMAGADSPVMTPETPFEIASITKAVTAATILRLVEKGKLGMDSRLCDVLPAADARGFHDGITIRQLLSHTSGLPDYWASKSFLRVFVSDPGKDWLPEEILSYARAMSASRPPSRFHYSDTNYVLLGRVIEHITKTPLHRVYEEEIFHPLGMQDTWLSYHEPRRGPPPSHRFEGKEDLNEVPRQSADWAGGGLVSTTRDLEKFLRGLVSGRLFQHAETLAVMLEAGPVGEESISYGKGLYRVDLGGKRGEVWGHDGHGNSFAYYWPQRGLFFTGTLNQTKNDWWPIIEACINPNAPLAWIQQNAFDVDLSVGWDSLYMFRGVNALRDGKRYGSGIAWLDLGIGRALTVSDTLSFEAWNCISTQGGTYRELDLSLEYTHSFGAFDLGCGYSLYYGYEPEVFLSNELNVVASYKIPAGKASITPSVGYFLTLGPESADGESAPRAGSGFLLMRVDARQPLFRDILALEPWVALGLNFQYNSRTVSNDSTLPFNGWNNFECGLAFPVKITESVTFSPYVAYSLAMADLPDTSPNTLWGGGRITFLF